MGCSHKIRLAVPTLWVVPIEVAAGANEDLVVADDRRKCKAFITDNARAFVATDFPASVPTAGAELCCGREH